MMVLQGRGVSPGVAVGPVHFVRTGSDIAFRWCTDAGREQRRFFDARQAYVEQTQAQAAALRKCGEATGADILEAHAMLARDDDFSECVLNFIREERCNAEYAVHRTGECFAAMLIGMDDAYMQARASDIRDVSGRIAGILSGDCESRMPEHPVILAADDLAPSQTLRLDRKNILGIITRKGSANSHTAILARTMGIPAVCGLGEGTDHLHAAKMVCVDGASGIVAVDPDESVLADAHRRQNALHSPPAVSGDTQGLEDITPDGYRLEIMCNISGIRDVEAVLENDGRGIGLFRSEFLYLASTDYPTEETQFEAYRAVVEAMGDRQVIIRTLDIGADKQADYFDMKPEENPALGLRGVRICLNRPEIFRVQLRAILRASVYGRIAVMFPMIASLWEVRKCMEICRDVMAELEREGIPFDKDMQFGVMIETPASVFIADELAREVDFFSVGTNDLAQYLLACDRQSGELDSFFDARHPALLRAVKTVADAAHRAGIRVGICGEIAADPELLPTFLAIGVDEISVAPTAVLPLRAQLRSTSKAQCTLEKLEGMM